MGRALANASRAIEYSCSWPAYINQPHEDLQNFAELIEIGCNGWRNFADIQCNWDSLSSIIDHWGDYGRVRCAFCGRNPHSMMPLIPTPARFKRASV